MYLNVKAVKKYIRDHHKQIAKDALAELDAAVVVLLNRAISSTRHFTRISKIEIQLALGVGNF
mgnify:CR=1 FL=1